MQQSSCFRGVYSADQIHQETVNILNMLPSGVIVNTDPGWLEGKHWIALYIYQTQKSLIIEYFDSFGYRSPEKFTKTKYFKTFVHVLKTKHNKQTIKIHVNKQRLQSTISSVCGQYCCMYLFFRCKFNNMNEIMDTYFTPGHNFLANDCKVEQLYRTIIQQRRKIKSRNELLKINQKCTNLCAMKKKIIQ